MLQPLIKQVPNMSMESQSFGGSNFFSLQGNILSETLFSSTQSDFMKGVYENFIILVLEQIIENIDVCV